MDYWKIFAIIEETIAGVDTSLPRQEIVKSSFQRILEQEGVRLGLEGVRVFRANEKNAFRHLAEFGDPHSVPFSNEIAFGDPLVAALRLAPLLLESLPGQDCSNCAAMELHNLEFIIVLSVSSASLGHVAPFALAALRYSLNSLLRAEERGLVVSRAREIQESILPRSTPEFANFDICSLLRPLDPVGGDYINFIQISEATLGLAIADAAGHGLPAALLTRDVHTALHMGVTGHFQISRIFEHLNRVLGGSRLTSRFVSLFYGELQRNGVFIYVNAGHPPPLLWTGNDCQQLEEGGPILGPLEGAVYHRGVARLEPGSTLVMYTDGVTEAADADGEEWGPQRLQRAIETDMALDSQALCDAILGRLLQFLGPSSPTDDIGLVVCKRTR